VFECRVLKKVCGSKREEVNWILRSFIIFTPCKMYVSRVIKSSRMRWAGHVAHMGEKSNVHRVLVVKPGEKRTL
jgi:hypothetical protein